ncbi:methylmalonyl-CoA epimerase [Candidatus Bathyarchaeota archaeon]|nr:methylmalonyl-CoA epimerase [Candidatus Bathyarchaeota archaeon]NIU81729.1 methylmalonyl-CoA epimerase [Candidatus Bathyarchaeota archaeon]NIV68045.1 methylmalonyl-CoA epimerase [Candidatus Bathyarchaeota archaeon]NIW16454.1 methylmalonyl-CoA epimerase [Candidatus Bathyarchaeota archaeon]NIW34574.1 methylmalonyl-CoA epimerase [Candidatus Bathyarchaeota archaeon]
MIRGLEHIGIAVKNLEEALEIYGGILGLEVEEIKDFEEQKVKIALLLAGETKIELLQPLDNEGPVAKFLEKRGEGVHHLAFTVADVEASLQELKKQGIAVVDERPRISVEGFKMIFLHPKSTKSVLVELCEK